MRCARRASPRLLLERLGERLPVRIADNEAGFGLLARPGRREAALGIAADGRFDIAHFESPLTWGIFDRHTATQPVLGCGYSWSGGAGLDRSKGDLRPASPG